jgi:superfamily II DNA or RNA helicase
LGSSNLTLSGLSVQGELNIDVLDSDATQKLSKWFEDRWNERWCLDITEDLIEAVDTSWAGDRLIPPYHIYLKIIWHLSQEARAGISTIKLPKEFSDELLEFQEKAVQIAAHHLNKRSGVLVGDVVGLGKTIIATAIARIFEDDFLLETLIICPKNLTKMWEGYVHKYRLRARVLSISRVQNELPELRRYRVVIIDESHNLRNKEGKRYRAIQEYIRENESKVILLTATPYNKTYVDLSNQLRLFILDDADIGIAPENYINSIGGRPQFSAKHQVPMRSVPAFEHSEFIDDWRELMRLYMVRRTRSFIKQNYAETDPENGRKYLTFSDGRRSYFPDRIPKRLEYEFNRNDPNDVYAKLYSQKVVDIINDLNLPRYGLGNYINDKSVLIPTDKEKIIIENLSRAGKRLKGFVRTNLFKRLESSGHSFLLSISRHIFRNFIFIYAIDYELPFLIGAQEANLLDEFLDDEDFEVADTENGIKLILDEEHFYEQAEKIYKIQSHEHRRNSDWIRSQLFQPDLRKLLLEDAKSLIKILKIGKDWTPEKDKQLNRLFDLLTNTHKEDKVLVFTQYADTAFYLGNELKKRGMQQMEVVTGGSDDPTAVACRFSPKSNESLNYKDTGDELRVIIATDVLSEGQNLQDAHIVVNYDLPWAIIRLIQRAGRVDRIGQEADQIVCYSVWPEQGIEEIINLRGRLRKRIQENAEVVGSDEVFFEGDPVNIKDLYNERAGILDDDKETEIDLASYAYQIWKDAIEADPSLEKTIPNLANVIYSTKPSVTDQKEGVIVYAKTADDNDVLAWIDKSGNLLTQSQYAVMKAAACFPDTKALYRFPEHHQLVRKSLDYIKDIETQIGGQLGKRTGARYRVYMRLKRYYDENLGTLFVDESLNRAIEDIYKYPLKEYAKDILNRQLKTGVDDQGLAKVVLSLREEEKLCIIHDDEIRDKSPKIICSLGLKEEV